MKWFNIDLRWAYGDLLGSIYRQTGSIDRAYDVLHESLVRLAMTSGGEAVAEPHAYLRTVARSVLANQRLEKARWLPFTGDTEFPGNDDYPDVIEARRQLEETGGLEDHDSSPEHVAYLRERLGALQHILDRLPQRCREVFWLSRVEGLSRCEIAERLCITPRTVRHHLERAFEDLAPFVQLGNDVSAIDEQAALWFMRMREAKAGDSVQRRFREWLTSDPACEKAYAAMVQLSRHFSETADDLEETTRQARRRFLRGGALGILLTAGTGELLYRHWQYRSQWRTAFNTAVGQIGHQMLADGSRLTLGGDTAVRVDFSRAERTVWLDRGQAIFEVARDVDRPFVVEGGLARITVLGTRFAVDRLDDKERISVDHGQVKVETGWLWRKQTLLLEDGQSAEVTKDDESAQTLRWSREPAASAFAFEQGKIIFCDASLSEVAETLSRYRAKPVRVGGETSDAPAITAIVHLSKIEDFLQVLPSYAPVTLTEETNRTVLGVRR